MRCPSCDSPSHQTRVVLTTRTQEDQVVRRRHCKACDHRWYTIQGKEQLLDGVAINWSGRDKVFLT